MIQIHRSHIHVSNERKNMTKLYAVLLTPFITLPWSNTLMGSQDLIRQSESQIVYPGTETGDDSDIFFGQRVADPYRWLEDDQSKAVSDWTDQQNALTFSYLKKSTGENFTTDQILP